MGKRGSLAVAASLYALLAGAPVVRAGDETLAETARARTFVKDSPLSQKVRVNLNSAGAEDFSRLHIDADAQGVVWLRGAVHRLQDAQRAIEIARGTDGVKSVNSRLRIEP